MPPEPGDRPPRPLRILFVCNYYPPLHFGGYEELCQDVAEGLRARGHRLCLLTSDHRPAGSHRPAPPEDPDLYRLLAPEVAIGKPLATPRLWLGRAARQRHNLRCLDRLLADFQPDVVVVWAMWNLTPAIAARLEAAMDSRILYYLADAWPILPDARTQHLGAPGRRTLSDRFKAILRRRLPASPGRLGDGLALRNLACVSAAVLKELRDKSQPIGQARVIHNGIDPSAFHAPVNGRPAAPPLRLLLAGRLTEDKGIFVAVEALALARKAGHDACLNLVGGCDAATEEALKRRIAGLGLVDQVELSGRIPRAAMPSVLAQHHVLLVPSIGFDTLPRSAQEGMAAGMTVIASRNGGLPELIEDDEHGLLVPPGDAAALAQAIGRLCSEPALLQRLAEAGQRRVEREFDIRMTVDKIEGWLQEIAGS
jgi:glycosyltransferase involved in cell wall biosynthesis